MNLGLDFDQCEWCADLDYCSRCELLSGEYALLCASCEYDLQQHIEDSWFPDDDESQPGQPAQL